MSGAAPYCDYEVGKKCEYKERRYITELSVAVLGLIGVTSDQLPRKERSLLALGGRRTDKRESLIRGIQH